MTQGTSCASFAFWLQGLGVCTHLDCRMYNRPGQQGEWDDEDSNDEDGGGGGRGSNDPKTVTAAMMMKVTAARGEERDGVCMRAHRPAHTDTDTDTGTGTCLIVLLLAVLMNRDSYLVVPHQMHPRGCWTRAHPTSAKSRLGTGQSRSTTTQMHL